LSNSIYSSLRLNIHEKDIDGKYQGVPIANKQDAYFVYSIAIGRLNMLGKKLTRD